MGNEWWFDEFQLKKDFGSGIIPGEDKLSYYLGEDDWASLKFLAKNTLARELPHDGPFPQYPSETICSHIYKTLENFRSDNMKNTWFDLSLLYTSILAEYVVNKDELNDTQKVGLTNAVSTYLASQALVTYTYHGEKDKPSLALGANLKFLAEDNYDVADATDDELYTLTLLRLVYDKRQSGINLDIESFLNGVTFDLNIVRDAHYVPLTPSDDKKFMN